VPALLTAACAPPSGAQENLAPREACTVLEAVASWWRIRLDVNDVTGDRTFTALVERAISDSEAWTVREPRRAEAWFYLGASYAARSQWRSVRGETLAAARDGKRIKDALEQAVRLDPGLRDARFGIGLYQYYADVVPGALKLLRWLLLLPGGDRAAGLRAMEEGRTGARLVRGEADYQLHLVYLWYEHAPERALELVRTLRARYPRNPHFAVVEADLHDVHRSDPIAALDVWRGLVDAAAAGRVELPAMAAARGRLGLAMQLDQLGDTDRAIDELRRLLASAPPSPVGIAAEAHLELGRALDRLGLRTEAAAEYKAALASIPAGDPLRTAARTRDAMHRPPAADDALAYRLSLEGWRALERGNRADAAPLLSRALALRPHDPATRYRHARLRLAEGRAAEAVAALEAVVSDPATPPHVYAAACYHAARSLEQQGMIPRAVELYRQVVDAFGADAVLKADAARALRRLVA
jgi:tetratricopeptide (TPR) repeat protein